MNRYWIDNSDDVVYEFNGSEFYLEEPVIYSVYPHVWEGTGVITRHGIRSTGQTLIDVTNEGLGDICEFDNAYDLRKVDNENT